MDSFRKLRKSSGATFSAFSKSLLLCGSILLFAPNFAAADSGVVSASGTGKDVPEAISNLLRSAVARHFREGNVDLTRAILQSEILANSSSFVQSYKISEGGRGGSVTLSANVDLDVIQALFGFTPKSLGEADGAKALVLVRGPKLPDSVLASLKNKEKADPFSSLIEGGRERFLRREFSEAQLSPEVSRSIDSGEDFSSPDLLRSLGVKAGARVVLGVSGRFETYENENSHNKEERIVLSATMVDVKGGGVIGRASSFVMNPKSRKEQYLMDLQRNLFEESRDLFQEVFVSAGRRSAKTETHAEFSVVRVLSPPNQAMLMRFKSLLETISGVRSVLDYRAQRGKYDFAVRPVMDDAVLAKAVSSLDASDLLVTAMDAPSGESESHPPAVLVRLDPKTANSPQSEGAFHANPNSGTRR